jgi:glycosyltransferase involved in cell wall biosynthesis
MAPPTQPVARVGLVATYARWKGHDVFLRALAALPRNISVRGYVVGGPVYRTGPSQWTRAELGDLAASLGLEGKVGFTGFVDEPAAAYRSLDIVVHASTAPEPFGLSIAEAMACGRATIISDAGGAREIGEPGTTCLAHGPGDAAGLSREIERLSRDGSLRSRIGAAGAASVRARFTEERHVAALRAAYGALPARHREA